MGSKVEIKPSVHDCKMCSDIAEMCDEVPNCSRCHKEGILLDIQTSFWGTYAFVRVEDKIEKVNINRIRFV